MGKYVGLIPKWVTNYVDGSKEIAKQARAWDTVSSSEQKARLAYDWIQSRFKTLDFLTESQRDSVKAKDEKASQAFKSGYASESHINYMYADMLREMNIDAKVGYVVDRDEDLFVESAKYWQFWRAIVMVPVDGKVMFTSPAQPFLPMGMLPWYNEGVSVLVSGQTEEQFAVTPFSPYSSNKTTRMVSLALDEDFLGSGVVSEILTGHAARGVRFSLRNNRRSDQESLIRDRVKDYFSNSEVDSINFENESTHLQPLKLSARLNMSESHIVESNDAVLLRPLKYIPTLGNPFTSDIRKEAVVFDYGWERAETVTLEIPEGWEVSGMPTDTGLVNTVGECSVRFTNFGSSISAQRLFRVNSPLVSAGDYAAVRQLFAAPAEFNSLAVTLKKAT